MRKFNVKVNGQAYEVEVEEISANSQTTAVSTVKTPAVSATPAPIVTPAPVAKAVGDGVQIKSPLPGVIVDFKVSEGATIKKGQAVIIIEAMKMENEIVANADGVISFATTKGATVDSGEVIAVIA